MYTQYSKSYSSSLRVSVNTVSFHKVTYFLEESACGSLYLGMFVNYTNHLKIQILWYRPDQRTWRKKEIRHFLLCLLSSFLCGRRNASSLWAVKIVTFLVSFPIIILAIGRGFDCHDFTLQKCLQRSHASGSRKLVIIWASIQDMSQEARSPLDSGRRSAFVSEEINAEDTMASSTLITHGRVGWR